VGQHILFVDDEAPIRELVSLFLRKKGMEVSTASNGQQARELAASTAFDLAILDVNLAGENGLELLSHFKATQPELPVLILSGLRDEDLVTRALAGGARGFMRKTDPLATLFEEIRKHLKT
jgi:DNA-binding response OmpR family regulator